MLACLTAEAGGTNRSRAERFIGLCLPSVVPWTTYGLIPGAVGFFRRAELVDHAPFLSSGNTARPLIRVFTDGMPMVHLK